MTICHIQEQLLGHTPSEPEVELRWRTEIAANRLTEVELDLLCPIFPELIAELMMTRGWTEAE